MPLDKIEVIRRGQAAFSRGDLTWVRDFVAGDVEWLPTGTFPGFEGVYRGPDAIDEWMETIRAEWQEFEVSLEEVLGEVEDAVVVAERLRGRGRESGAEVEMRLFSIYVFDAAGRVKRRRGFTSRDEALEALERR